MKTEVIFLCPLRGTGGIVSWSRKFLETFPKEQYAFYTVDISPDKDFTLFRRFDRFWYGLKSLIRIWKSLRRTIRLHPEARLLHITTSGQYGSLRDCMAARMMHRAGGRCVLHCHFGSVKENSDLKGWRGSLFRKSLNLYDQIWVLDERSAMSLRSNPNLRSKVYVTPNSIVVPAGLKIQPKKYTKIGYVGNVIKTKGVQQLVEAVVTMDNATELYIVGDGPKDFLDKLRSIAGDKLGRKIHLLGRLPNNEAVALMESLDIIALPTYYEGEAFPISILEAMSRGKLVVSCPRAAIPDILTSTDGSPCGLLVPPRDPKALVDAFRWCQEHHNKADMMCRKAYSKVATAYSTDVVYRLYSGNYQELIDIN